MTRSAKAARPATRFASATFATALILSGVSSFANADTMLPASALAVRNAIIAMSLADAAIPFAVAISDTRDERPAVVPASSAAMKPENSAAMASIRTASARNTNAGYYSTVSYDRRVRSYNIPFPLILGIAY